jgi:hypothetical protein
MSITTATGARYVAEVRYTCDIKIPFVENDYDLRWGWRCHPVRPPTDDGEDPLEVWEIFDESKDDRTGWRRWHRVEGSA